MTKKGTSYNVVFFGKTGVGKSSVIQRIAGTATGTINNDTAGATILPKASEVTICAKRYQIWDTAGLNEGSKGRVPAKKAEKALKHLLSNLTRSEGVHLLVFCMRAGRVTRSLKGSYQTFVQKVCKERVPVVLVVTCLDKRDEREAWWKVNGPKL
ncbi:P-loop containing nucleoside triphosphate hydrolase protein [Paxillus ammoniavirescens]|nr:P-loop containing nucleoside triphosphate hydrolase protein [Paxillus ammoniavirescens]